MIWAIIGIVIAIILGCTALFFHQKQRKHSWIPAILAIIMLAGSGLYARHEIINHNSHPQAARQTNRRPAKMQRKNKQGQNQQRNKRLANQKQNNKQGRKPVNSKFKNLKHKIAKGIVVIAIMALIAGAIIDG